MVVVDRQSVTATVVDVTATMVVITGSEMETELVEGADTSVDNPADFVVALTTAVSDRADEC